MKRARMIGLIVALMSGLIVGETVKAQTGTAAYPAAPAEDVKTAASGNNAFGIDLYARLSQGSGNVLFSPYSISSAMGMVYAGARGQTAAQMAATMHFSLADARLHAALGALSGELQSEGRADRQTLYQLSVADAVWAQRGLSYNPDFREVLRKDYAAELHESDFIHALEQARVEINKWVAEKTVGKIPDLFKAGSLDSSIRMVLVNAIYFKGNWATQFEKGQTSDQAFHLDRTRIVSASLMFENVNCPAWQDEQLQVAELPYNGGKLSMVILLPRSADGLAALEKSLTQQNVDHWINRLSEQRVNVWLPKFKLGCSYELAKVLAAMGMQDAFGNSADFSGMTTADRFRIDDVVHEAVMEVNEEGTEAAAATGVKVATMAIAPGRPPMDFRADHPFVFLLRQRSSGAILFVGRLANPK